MELGRENFISLNICFELHCYCYCPVYLNFKCLSRDPLFSYDSAVNFLLKPDPFIRHHSNTVKQGRVPIF
jgi:hypothetical protein